MAEIVPELEQRKGYPWAQWTDGQVYRAEKGKDFTCTVDGFIATLYGRARRFKLVVRTSQKDGDVVHFQFSKPARTARTPRRSSA